MRRDIHLGAISISSAITVADPLTVPLLEAPGDDHERTQRRTEATTTRYRRRIEIARTDVAGSRHVGTGDIVCQSASLTDFVARNAG